MKFILITRSHGEDSITIEDIEADSFDAAIRAATLNCVDGSGAGEDSSFISASLAHVTAIVDMDTHIEKELTARAIHESARVAAEQEAAERAEFERLRAKFEPKREHVASLSADPISTSGIVIGPQAAALRNIALRTWSSPCPEDES